VATHEQHKWYRGVVLPILAEHWGWAVKSELHRALKVEHIPPSLWIDGEPPSSAALDVEQFSAFLQSVLYHAGEEQIEIPPPGGREY